MALKGQTTYSFMDTTGAFTHPDVGDFQFAGQIGAGQFVVEMLTDKTEHNISADAAVMVSAIAGDNGNISIEVQQTSPFHTFLMAWYNTVKTAMMARDVTNWAAGALTLRNITDGSQHICTGISPSRIPAKTYAGRGQMLTWVLACADIQSITVPPLQ